MKYRRKRTKYHFLGNVLGVEGDNPKSMCARVYCHNGCALSRGTYSW